MKLHRILFCIFLFCLPFQTRILFQADQSYVSWYFDYHLAIFLYLTDIILIACFTHWLIFDRPSFTRLVQSKVFLLCISLISLILVTLFHVKRIDLGWYETFKWLEFLGIIIYVRETFRVKHYFYISAILLFIAGIFQGILGWIQFHMQHMIGLRFIGEYIAPIGTLGLSTISTQSEKLIRAYGTMPQPNVLGGFLVLSLILGLFFVSQETSEDKKPKIIHYLLEIGIILILIGIFTTFSRMSWLASVIAMTSFIIFFWVNKNWKKIGFLVFVGIVSCATIVGLYSYSLKSRVTNTDPNSVSYRELFNEKGIETIKRFPILGVGVGNYVVAQQDLFHMEPWQYQPPHNIFIFLAAELGFLGLGLFLMILYEIFSKLKNVFQDPLVFSLTLAGILFLVLGQLDHYFVTIQQGRLMFAVVLGLLAALPNLNAQSPIHNDHSNPKS